MEELMKEIDNFNKERDWDQFHSEDNLAKSISIEAGELLECFQWNDDYDKEEVCEELADVLIYCFYMADSLDLDISEIMLDKMKKNTIKYPVDKSKGNAKKYTEF